MWTAITIVCVLSILILAVIAFVNLSPQIGQKPAGQHLEGISKSENYGTDSFVNLTETTTGDIWAALKVMPEMISDNGKSPRKPLPVDFSNGLSQGVDSLLYFTWYGHSAFLLEVQGLRILIDPMLGDVAAPTSMGSKRFEYQQPIPIERLKNIDVVLISHDHYDHLDYPTIQKIKQEVSHFITPLGVGSHLRSWGVAGENVTELDWWQQTTLKDVVFTSCPSRHFSGRGLTDRNATQWSSWVLKTKTNTIYFSGDGGYGTHFSQISEEYGPFDFAMLECGQYTQAWRDIHMMPEETVQAGLDLRAELVMPIHWGAFRLAPHSWTDPITRFTKAADEKQLPYILPTIGQRFRLGVEFPKSEWWREVM